MFHRVRRICRRFPDVGEVVEILQTAGVRRAKIMAAGRIVEVAALGGGEIHLGDRIAFSPRPFMQGVDAALERVDFDDALDGIEDNDMFPLG
jgi:hypothetical protein